MKQLNYFRFTLGLVLLMIVGMSSNRTSAQSTVDGDQLGAWYMYFWNATIKKSSWGFQGDVQFRNWDVMGDLEQLLIRGGVTYKPKNANAKFTLGYASITSGTFGKDNSTTHENRIYQEALLPHRVGQRFYLTHRFRYEQRFVETAAGEDFRTRYRYNLFINIPINKKEIVKNTVYLALYNELFIRGEWDSHNNPFDRNRLYGAIGFKPLDKLKVQLGVMRQKSTSVAKNQLQISLHHTF